MLDGFAEIDCSLTCSCVDAVIKLSQSREFAISFREVGRC